MDRKKFLSVVGLTTGSLAILTCLGCSKTSSNGPSTKGPTGIDFTLDLSAAANSQLLQKGGFIQTNGLLVAQTLAGAYLAVQLSCTHQSYPLIYDANSNNFYCNNHGSAFSSNGMVLNSPARDNLATYKTSLSGNSLRVYS
jgi:cytochrome b6-f complex iron-sulfur subunit